MKHKVNAKSLFDKKQNIIKHQKFIIIYKMGKEILMFEDIEIEKK